MDTAHDTAVQRKPFPPRQPSMTLNQSQLSCLVSPLRKELLAAFGVFGPAPVDEIAHRIGRRAKSLYYHVELLVQVGLIRQVGVQTSGRRPEAIFDAVAQHFHFDSQAAPEYGEEIRRSVQTLVRAVGREFDRASRNTRQAPAMIRAVGRLSPEHRREFQRRLSELVDWAKENEDPTHPRLGLTHFIVPLD